MKVLIATKNAGKVKEFQFMFAEMGVEVSSLLDVENAPDVEETGTTFAENARLKAEEIANLYHLPVISDDSGLVIDALGGRPGVFSARYAGIEKDDEKIWTRYWMKCAAFRKRSGPRDLFVHWPSPGRVRKR